MMTNYPRRKPVKVVANHLFTTNQTKRQDSVMHTHIFTTEMFMSIFAPRVSQFVFFLSFHLSFSLLFCRSLSLSHSRREFVFLLF